MRISVIVPVYNVEPYLKDCLSSLVQQSIPFFEIVLVNDGSTDGSLAICEHYCRQYPFIKLICQENQGQAVARNVGITAATGDYIIFVDSDDYVHLDTNERLLYYLNDAQVEVLYFNGEIKFDVPYKTKKDTYVHNARLNGPVLTGISYVEGSFPHHGMVSVGVVAYKKSFLSKYEIFFPDGLYFEDHYFALQVNTNAKTVKCVPDILYVRRYRENSTMTSPLSEKKCRDKAANQVLRWKYLAAHQWWGRESLARKYISSELLGVLRILSGYSDQKPIIPIKRNLAEEFVSSCFTLFAGSLDNWYEALTLCLMLREADKAELRGTFPDLSNWDEVYWQAKQYIQEAFVNRILSVPFQQTGEKIGIYGIGQHTTDLLELYKRLAGDIRCEVYFIVSECEDGRYFQGKPVVSCERIPTDTSHILISSRLYQEEMIGNLLSAGVEKEKIIALYRDDDICDLTILRWVIEQ